MTNTEDKTKRIVLWGAVIACITTCITSLQQCSQVTHKLQSAELDLKLLKIANAELCAKNASLGEKIKQDQKEAARRLDETYVEISNNENKLAQQQDEFRKLTEESARRNEAYGKQIKEFEAQIISKQAEAAQATIAAAKAEQVKESKLIKQSLDSIQQIPKPQFRVNATERDGRVFNGVQVHEGAAQNSKTTAIIPHEAAGVLQTGLSELNDTDVWVPISYNGELINLGDPSKNHKGEASGYVHRRFLVPIAGN